MESNGSVVKTLWLLAYHTGEPQITRDTVGHLTFFYAADEVEARVKADEFKKKQAEKTQETIHEEELKAQPRGFTIARTSLNRRLHCNPDGTPQHSPYHESGESLTTNQMRCN